MPLYPAISASKEGDINLKQSTKRIARAVTTLLSEKGLCQDGSGRVFSSHFTEEVVEISGPLFPIFKINSFFASGKGNRPDVLEISANLLLGKMRRLAITSWALIVGALLLLLVGDSGACCCGMVPHHCPQN